jgi:glycosyltransferase involved in cell wall biosynthesis
LEINSPLMLERSREPGLGLPSLAKWCEGAAWRGADLTLPVTGVLAQHVIEAGVAPEKILVLHNGISREHFAPSVSGDAIRARHGLDGKLVIGFTGFLRAWHGLPEVLQVISEMEGQYALHFLVVGDGPARADLEREAKRLGIEHRMTITGLVQRDQIPGYVAAFDIAVQPKATPYASPLKLFEYMALGRAIVAPDQLNVQEVLTDGVNGLLFVPGDSASLKAALLRLIADPNERQRLGAGAQATMDERNLTWDGNATRICAYFAGMAKH